MTTGISKYSNYKACPGISTGLLIVLLWWIPLVTRTSNLSLIHRSLVAVYLVIIVTSHERYGVSTHWRPTVWKKCMFNSLFRLKTTKTPNYWFTGLRYYPNEPMMSKFIHIYTPHQTSGSLRAFFQNALWVLNYVICLATCNIYLHQNNLHMVNGYEEVHETPHVSKARMTTSRNPSP